MNMYNYSLEEIEELLTKTKQLAFQYKELNDATIEYLSQVSMLEVHDPKLKLYPCIQKTEKTIDASCSFIETLEEVCNVLDYIREAFLITHGGMVGLKV